MGNMKAFFCIALVSAASAAPQLLAGHRLGHAVVAGGQRSHQSVSKPFQGEVRTTSQAKSFGSPIASVASSDSVSNTAQSGLASHLGQGAVVGGVAHGVVGHGIATLLPTLLPALSSTLLLSSTLPLSS